MSSSEEITDYSKIKMCPEKDNFKQVEKFIESFKMITGEEVDEGTVKKMRAAFLKSKLWSVGRVINVGFRNKYDPNTIERTSTSKLKTEVDSKGVRLKMDPLQLEVDDMSVQDAIIYIVMRRFNDEIHPKYKPKSVEARPANYTPKPLVGVRFNFFDPDDPNKLINPEMADIRIDFKPDDGAWSLLGTDCLSAKKTAKTMNFAWFDVPTILHEFGHSLGMVHEHSNPNGIPINWSICRVSKWANETQGWDAKTIKENIIEKYSVDQINGSEFDPKSIMLYFFPGSIVCKDGSSSTEGASKVDLPRVEACFEGCPTDKSTGLTACNLKKDTCERPGKGTTQNLRFSPWDVLYLNKIYQPSDQIDTAQEFTVKWYSENYGETITESELTRQIKLTEEREKTGVNKPAEKFNDVKTDTQSQDDTSISLSFNQKFGIFIFVIIFFYIIYKLI